jgi:hypothetical protein
MQNMRNMRTAPIVRVVTTGEPCRTAPPRPHGKSTWRLFPWTGQGEVKEVVQVDSREPSSSVPVITAVAFAAPAAGTR